MALFNYLSASVKLASGKDSKWLIDCGALSDEDIATIAKALKSRLPVFSSVEGVPDGGLRLAEAMKPYAYIGGPVLIVDDVWTTGGSWLKHKGNRDAIGAVIFERGPLIKEVIAFGKVNFPEAQ